MKKVLVTIIFLLSLVNMYGQIARFHILSQTKKNARLRAKLDSCVVAEAVTNAPTFKLRDEVPIPDLFSYYTPVGVVPTNMGEVYNNVLKLILQGKDKNACKYLKKIICNKKYSNELKEHAYYQLAHYDWYGCFDKYYNGVPSNMERTEVQSSNKKKNKISFENANEKTCLLMYGNPTLPTYNLELIIERCCYLLSSKTQYDCVFAKSVLETACQPSMVNNVSLYNIFYNRYYKQYENKKYGGADCVNSDKFEYIVKLTKVLPYLSRMKQNASIHDIGKTDTELCEKAEKLYNENNYVESFYYYVRSALFGNIESLMKIYEVSEQHLDQLYKLPELKKYKSRLWEHHYHINSKKLAESIYLCPELHEFTHITKLTYEHTQKNYSEYFKQKKIKIYNEFAEEQARKERRQQFWLGVLQEAVRSMCVDENQIAFHQQYNVETPQMSVATNVRNMNRLLDPRFAMAQVNAQDYARYQSARVAFQRMGMDLSVDEWRTMEGQAILNLKAQGYDPIAEQKKINEQQKADFAKRREEDKKAWFAQYGYESNSFGTITQIQEKTSTKISNTNYEQPKKLVKESNKKIEEDKNLDSKEQYISKKVSSDDYHFEKYVNLYVREANRNKVMFRKKELCKKGASYYVKIDNMYYLVYVQGGWGFNSSIIYAHTKLYFDK